MTEEHPPYGDPATLTEEQLKRMGRAIAAACETEAMREGKTFLAFAGLADEAVEQLLETGALSLSKTAAQDLVRALGMMVLVAIRSNARMQALTEQMRAKLNG